MKNMSDSDSRRVFLYAITAGCIGLMLAASWSKISLTEQIPTYDAFEYYRKAKNFWDAAAAYTFVNPFNLAPTLRPPGTILMSYPFGFSEDAVPFYFRSIAFGMIALAAAILLANRSDDRSRPDWAVLAIIGCSGLPMFYQYEIGLSPVGFFGLVDCFFAGVSALATSAMLMAVSRQSKVWVLAFSATAAFSLMVKPTGLAIMALVCAAWLLGAGDRILRSLPAQRPPLLRHIMVSFGIICAVYGVTLLVSFNSQYLSEENVNFGISGQQVLQRDFSGFLDFDALFQRLSFSFGPLFITSTMTVIVYNTLRPRFSLPVFQAHMWQIACSLTFLIVGIGIWLVTSNGSQIRYFYPFALSAFILAVPVLSRLFDASPTWIRVAAAVLLLAPLSWTFYFLVTPGSEDAARRFGLTIDAGPASDEARKADEFIDYLRERGGPSSSVYTLGPWGPATMAFGRRASLENLMRPGSPSFGTLGPVDWLRPSVVREDELSGAGFLLVHRVDNPSERAALFAMSAVDDFQTELSVFRAWATGLGLDDGVREILATPSSTLYEVVDRERLLRSVGRLKADRNWRSVD